MALALYRKYRPATFAEVVGQEHVTGPLMTAVDSGRINHAYLFSGPRGCGKTSSARILARSLNCEQGPTSRPCGQCQSCIDLAPDGSGNIDVIEIDAASHGGVDDARDLRERAFQLPVSSRYKIYIIDEAHMVSNQGFNALLKVVEEPPESVVFIFATTEPDKVLPTIRSRTHHYPFRLVPPSAMRDLLERNCESEGVTVGAAVLPLVVRAGGGSVRDSQSLLDQLIAGAGPGGITYEDALALLGVTDAALLDDMVEAIGVADGATVFGTVNRLIDAGHDPRRFGVDLLDRLRDLILMAAVPDAGEKGLIDAPEDHIERLVDQSRRLGLSTLSRLADIVHVGLTEMRGTTAPRLGLELICARMLLPAVGDDGASMTQRIERLERRMEIGGLPSDTSGGADERRVAGGRGVGRSAAGGDAAGVGGAGSGAAGSGAGDRGSPRQRAEARLASSGARPPAASAVTDQTAATGSADQAEATDSAAQPAATRPADEAAATTRTGQVAPTASADRAAATGAADRAVSSGAPSSGAGSPAPVAEPASPSAPRTPAQPAASDDGWPEVRAPGSGRPQKAAGTSQVSPSAPGSAPDPQPATPAQESSATESPSAERAAGAGTDSARADEPAANEDGGAAGPEGNRPAAPKRPAPDGTAAAASTAGTAGKAPSSDFDIAEVRRQWRSVVDVIKRSSRASAALVETATPVAVRGGALVITAPPALLRRLADPQQHRHLQAALQDVLGVSWSIEVSDDPASVTSGAPSATAAEPPDDEFEVPDADDESAADPRAGLDPGQAAVNLIRDEFGAEEISPE